MLKDVLFDGIYEVPNQEVIRKMKYFINKADQGMESFNDNKQESLKIAKELRSELRNEYKNNDLIRISKIYKDHDMFSRYYKPAVHEALVSVTGALSYNNVHSFLYNVQDYMKYYVPSEERRKF